MARDQMKIAPGTRHPLPPPRSFSPAPFERPENIPAIEAMAKKEGGRIAPASVRVSMGDVDVRVGRSFMQRIGPWLAPVVLTVLGSVGGAVLGYYEGLAAAGRRVAAVEQAIAVNAEADARHEKKTALEMAGVRVVLDDHDERLPKLERRVDRALPNPKISGP